MNPEDENIDCMEGQGDFFETPGGCATEPRPDDCEEIFQASENLHEEEISSIIDEETFLSMARDSMKDVKKKFGPSHGKGKEPPHRRPMGKGARSESHGKADARANHGGGQVEDDADPIERLKRDGSGGKSRQAHGESRSSKREEDGSKPDGQGRMEVYEGVSNAGKLMAKSLGRGECYLDTNFMPKTSERFTRMWESLEPPDPQHPYLMDKRLDSSAIEGFIRQKGGDLYFPIHKNFVGPIVGLVRIGPDGLGTYEEGSEIKGNGLVLGEGEIGHAYFCWDLASAVSYMMAFPKSMCLVAFEPVNMGWCAANLKIFFRRGELVKKRLVVGADNDVGNSSLDLARRTLSILGLGGRSNIFMPFRPKSSILQWGPDGQQLVEFSAKYTVNDILKDIGLKGLRHRFFMGGDEFVGMGASLFSTLVTGEAGKLSVELLRLMDARCPGFSELAKLGIAEQREFARSKPGMMLFFGKVLSEGDLVLIAKRMAWLGY